jgi:hypothetical protein
MNKRHEYEQFRLGFIMFHKKSAFIEWINSSYKDAVFLVFYRNVLGHQGDCLRHSVRVVNISLFPAGLLENSQNIQSIRFISQSRKAMNLNNIDAELYLLASKYSVPGFKLKCIFFVDCRFVRDFTKNSTCYLKQGLISEFSKVIGVTSAQSQWMKPRHHHCIIRQHRILHFSGSAHSQG